MSLNPCEHALDESVNQVGLFSLWVAMGSCTACYQQFHPCLSLSKGAMIKWKAYCQFLIARRSQSQARGGGSGNQRSPKPSCMTLGWYRIAWHRGSSFASMHHSRDPSQLVYQHQDKLISIIATSLDINTSEGGTENAIARLVSKQSLSLYSTTWRHSGMMTIRDFDELLQSLFEVPILQLMVTIHGTLPESKVWGTWKEIELDKLDPTSALNGFLCLSDIQEQHFYPHLNGILAALKYPPSQSFLLHHRQQGSSVSSSSGRNGHGVVRRW